MTRPEYTQITVEQSDGILAITLNRPAVRNAMNLAMVEEIGAALDAVADDLSTRIVVLRGAGGNFCARADIKDMVAAKSAETTDNHDPVFELNRAFGRMIAKVDSAPQVVITCLEGAVLGGGFGLACVSDIAIADSRAKFDMPETGLGLPPAQIVPYVVTRVGLTQARRLVLTGARFDGVEAERLGVVHFVTEGLREMNALLERQITQIRNCAPLANRITKELILRVASMDREALLDEAAQSFATAVRSTEGREGTRAFAEKRRPTWARQDGIWRPRCRN